MVYSSKHKRGITWELPTSSSSFLENDKWWVQYPVIYFLFVFFYVWSIVIASAVIVLFQWKEEQERSQKIDDLPILATCQSGILAMVSSKVITVCCSGKHSIMTDMAPSRPLTNLTQTCHLCTFIMATISFRAIFTYGIQVCTMIRMSHFSYRKVSYHRSGNFHSILWHFYKILLPFP